MSTGTEYLIGFILAIWTGMSVTLGLKYLQYRYNDRRCWCGIRHFPHHVIGRR